jgi:hypothetical protein
MNGQWATGTTGVHIIAFLLSMALPPLKNFCHTMVARISCSLVNEIQKVNHKRCLKTMNNQNNSQVLQNIQPKCPGMHIGAKQRMIVTRSVNEFLTG